MLGRAAAMLVRAYQVSLGRLLPSRCRFHPSCSEFAVRALRANGLLLGGMQAAWRLVRCGPWTSGGIDEVRVLPTLGRALGRVRARHG